MSDFMVSQSKVNAWRLCRQKYEYQYEQHLGKKAKPRPLKFGTIVHEMMSIGADKSRKAAFHHLDEEVAETNKRLFIQEQEMYGDIVTDIRYIMTAYFDYWKDDPLTYVKINGKKTEHLLVVPLINGITFKGTLDGVANNKALRWIVEHKSHGQFPNDDHRWRNLQTSIYIPMAERAGINDLDGVVWDYIRSKAPTRPKILKKGGLSERVVDSLPQVFIDTLKENQLKLFEYQAAIDAQIANLGSWFQRVYTPIKAHVISKVQRDFINTAKEMADGEWKTTRNIGRHCDWCQFESLCRAELQGGDVKYVREHEYEIEPDRYEKENET